MTPDQLKKHIISTYLSLRIGMALMAVLLAPVLVFGGSVLNPPIPPQDSLSAYYHAGNGAMRDVFVGILVAVGAFLYLYKGYTNKENIALNLAGIFVIGGAFVPMEWPKGSGDNAISLHGIFAVLFFLSIAYVSIWRSKDTLALIKDEKTRKRFSVTYTLLGSLMVASPAIAFIITLLVTPRNGSNPFLLIVEIVAVLIFAAYWITKSFEVVQTNSELRAVQGELVALSTSSMNIFEVDEMKGLRDGGK